MKEVNVKGKKMKKKKGKKEYKRESEIYICIWTNNKECNKSE